MAYRTKNRFLFLAQRDGRQCFYCKKPIKQYKRSTFDHVIPKALGGKDALENLVLACAPCNFAKANKLPDSLKDPQG